MRPDQCFVETLRPITAVGACVVLPPSMAAPVAGRPICVPLSVPLAVSGAAAACEVTECELGAPAVSGFAALMLGPPWPGPCGAPIVWAAVPAAGRPIAFRAGATTADGEAAVGCAAIVGGCG